MKYTIFLFSLLFLQNVFAEATLKDAIIPSSSQIGGTATGFEGLTSVFVYARDSIFALLALVAIGVFLFIGARLVIARGNPEEFKKTLMMFIYAIVGLFVISVAYAAVRMVAGLNF